MILSSSAADLPEPPWPDYCLGKCTVPSSIGATSPRPCGGLLSEDAQRSLARYDITLPKDVLVDPQIFSVKTIDLGAGLVRHYQRTYLNMDRCQPYPAGKSRT